MKDAQGIFHHFAFTEYLYDCGESDTLWELMSEQDRKVFPFNARTIDWERTFKGFQYGIRRFYMNEDCYGPEEGFTQLLQKNQEGLFHDLRVSSKPTPIQTTRDNIIYFNAVLNPDRFRAFFQRIASMKKVKEIVPFGNEIKKKELPYYSIKFNHILAKQQIQEMHSKITTFGLKSMIWWFNKNMRYAV